MIRIANGQGLWGDSIDAPAEQVTRGPIDLASVMREDISSGLAHARSGYQALVKSVTMERVRQHFERVCLGKVERFELSNLQALNFLLREALDGGGTVSLRVDPQRKTFSTALLRMQIEVDEMLTL